ncbi:ribbon-helix-helix domain-containing protein [Shewanella sp. JM162201]|uniref:Ribbon-helix-helix domain-containing protein n=1 Tax=Shewanella jiangmenensis TaxID=2837387 RepID=A0ABS5UYH6_9GAMM|nr:ribbon-helix-helix domain-containing protein [Shewanella jiangmenensis]MBT1443140.1 ribbon-helix-helix domain-containing protein [Shewanella jiangmenensis]
MSLTDLKRKKPKLDRGQVSVDDFIEDANNYAFGRPTILDEDGKAIRAKFGLDKSTTKVYRHATFSLTTKAIDQLDSLAKQTGIAKSKLLRILIKEFHDKSSGEQSHILLRGEDEQ